MDTQQFPQYLAVFGSLALFFDTYYTIALTKFLKSFNLPKAVVFIPRALFCIGIISISYNLYIRFTGIEAGIAAEYMFYFAITWYAPKFLIAPLILMKDLNNYLRNKIKRKPRQSNNIEDFCLGRRRSFIRDTAWLLSFMPYIIIVHSFIAVTYNYQVKEIEIPLAKLSAGLDGFRIVHISDLHAGSFSSSAKFDNAVDIINRLNPDIIVITGDFVNFHPVELAFVASGLKKLRPKYGTFGCLGNHDHYMYPVDHRKLIDSLEACGVNLLINENSKIGIGADTLQIAGLDNISYRHNFGDLEEALPGTNNEFPVILLLHDPYRWTSMIIPSGKIGLTLGGHTHGGQMVLNVDGITLSHMRLRYIHWRGYYNENGNRLYLTSGIGTVGIPFRFGVQPEITLIKLKKDL